ncbi:hypothetical protein E4U53_001718 [Claviceps sorghi]|nr:hypothetical protein E4U53_001718 [Claviceps sorghi]
MAARDDGFEKQPTLECHGVCLSGGVHRDSCESKRDDIGDGDADYGFSRKEQAKIIRRVDRRLVLTVGAMYCVSLMDRTNMSSAMIAGMDKQLTLVGNRYVSRGKVLPVARNESHGVQTFLAA